MMSEVEQRPRLVTAGYGQHGSQWVKGATKVIFGGLTQSTVGKKMAAVHFTTMPCEPNTAHKSQMKKAKSLQHLSLYYGH